MLPSSLAFAIFALYLCHRIYTNIATMIISREDYQERFKKITKGNFPTIGIISHTLSVLALYTAFLQAGLPYFWLLVFIYYLVLTCLLIFMVVHPLLSDTLIEDAVTKSATINDEQLAVLKGRARAKLFLSIAVLYLWCHSWNIL